MFFCGQKAERELKAKRSKLKALLYLLSAFRFSLSAQNALDFKLKKCVI